MRKDLLKRLRDRRGFTLGELLVTILILLMVSGVVAAGIPVAKEAYVKVVDSANAEILMSTTMTALRFQLGSAQKVQTKETDNGQELVWYYSGETAFTSLGNAPDDAAKKGIMLYPFMKEKSTGDGYDPNADYSHLLVSGTASTVNLYTEYDYITYDEEKKLFYVNGLRVIRELNREKATFAEVGVFTVRAVNMVNA